MARISLILSRLGEILWRSFGLYVKYLRMGVVLGGAGAGITGDIKVFFLSLVAAFIPALIEAWSEIGEEIARDAKVTKSGINKAFNKAADSIDKQEKTAEGKSSK